MLYLDQPIFYINGLQIHRDFQNPNQFYFFPGAPRVHRRDGVPDFQLIKYARDVTDNPLMPSEATEQVGGAFLVFTADIGVDEEILEDIRSQLSTFADGEVQLAPVQFHTGSVRLLALGVQEETPDETPETPSNIFVEKVYGTSKPSLYGDNLALFGLHLKQEGATLLEDSFRHGGGLLGVVYDLTYAGMRPALQVKAKVDFERVYNHFEVQLGFQYAMIGAEIGAQLQWLREQRAIEIEITQYDTDPKTAAEMRKEAMELVKQEVISAIFKPSLQIPESLTRGPGSQGNLMEQVMRYADRLRNPNAGAGPTTPAPQPTGRMTTGEGGDRSMNSGRGSGSQSGETGSGGGPGRSSGFALTFSLKYLRQEERKTAEFDFRVHQAVDRNAAPQGSLRLLLRGVNVDDHIREVNLDDPFFRELRARIGVAGNWETLGIDKVIVNATYQPDPDGPIVHTDGWTFNASNEPPKPFNVLLDRNRPVRLYNYKTEVLLKDLAHIDSKERTLSIEDTTEQRELLINPANEFKPVMVRVEAGAIDWTKVVRVDVMLHYVDSDNDFSADQRFSFRSDRDEPHHWVVYPMDPLEKRTYQVTYGYTLRDDQGNTTYFEVGPEDRADEGIVAPPPFKGTRTVYVTPAVDKENIREILAELLYEHQNYRFYRQLRFERDTLGTQLVDIPIPDPNPDIDTYRARWSVLFSNFETYESEWTDFQSMRLLLEDGLHTVGPVYVGLEEPPGAAGLRSVSLKLESLNPGGNVVDTEVGTISGSDRAIEFDLTLEKGTPLRYRFTYTKRLSDGSREVIGPEERTDREIYLEL